MADKAPAFQFYPRDFIGDLDVAALSLEEVGAYTLLLCYAWLKDGLPNDHAKLAKALHVPAQRFERIWTVIGQKFSESDDGRLKNERQEEERRKQAAWREKSSEGGKRGHAHHNHPPTTVEPPLEPDDNQRPTLLLQSSSASTPLAPQGGRITRKERKDAEEHRRKLGGCYHTPRCASFGDCVGVIVWERRGAAREARTA